MWAEFMKGVLPAAISSQSGLGFGCMGITAFYGDPMPDEKALKLLQGVYDAGSRHFDTAEVYRTGDLYNETVLGKFFQTVPRDSFTVATKYWPQDERNDYESVKAHLQASLQRLGLDYVDLYYAHRITNLKGALEFGHAAKCLQQEGLVREIGLSEVSPAWLKQIHSEIVPITSIQQEWSLMTRNIEKDLVPMCKELGIVIVAYSPLARNLLATKLETPPSDWRANQPRYQEDNLKVNQKIVSVLEEVATKYDCKPATLALAWLFQRAQQLGVSVVPIPGTTKLERALSNIQSTKIDFVTDEDMETLEKLADMVAGARANEKYVNMAFESQQ